MQLVIVESPKKAITIEKYIGGKYKVVASGGHIRDLPVHRFGVNISGDFSPTYEITPKAKDRVESLRKVIDKADGIFLATDPDREGEAISWHIQEVFGLKGKCKRIEFNEISEKAVKNALENPRDIDYNLVDSQQARRVLDRIVGYKLSPFLCKRIKDGLSAGRVQSVVLKLIVDKEREIKAFVPQEYWNLTATFGAKKPPQFKALLLEKDGKKYKPATKEEADAVYEQLRQAVFTVKDIAKSVTSTHPFPPFTTSTLEQDAAAKLGMNSATTMKYAQQLYEGIEIGGEHVALVTYIRTDSTRISVDAQNSARGYISEKFGKEYVPTKPNIYKAKKSAQDAHEAIRPIDVKFTPERLEKLISDKKLLSLYKLIYNRFLASQMSAAEYDTVKVEVEANGYVFKTSGKTMKFNGFTVIYDDFTANDSDEDDNSSKNLPAMEKGDILNLKDIKREQKFTKPPVRYTDSSIVKAMEDKGIGRPSTYHTILDMLSKRKYIGKDGKSIVPNEIAYTMTDMLTKYFADIMDVSFTANMETKLDDIADGDIDWRKLIEDFYVPFNEKLIEATNEGNEITDIKCDACGENMIRRLGRYGKYLYCPSCKKMKSESEEISDIPCENCKDVNYVYKTGKYGKFLACPKCMKTRPIEEKISAEKCAKCGGEMVEKTGRFGKYLQCKVCKNTKSITEKAGICPECGSATQKLTSKSGKVFYGCTSYPHCNFYSWDMPTGERCPKCNAYLIYSKDGKTIKCSDKDCDYSVKNEKH